MQKWKYPLRTSYGFGTEQHSPALAGSSALASSATFQLPSASFLQTVMYLPVVPTVAPVAAFARPS